MTSSAPTGGTLRRSLGLWQVSLSGIGVILGAGVYALIGPAAALAGNLLWMSFLLAGITAGLTAYAYARLGSLVPKNSPEFQYTAVAFGPRAGFVAACLMLVADLLAAATVTVGFGGYLRHLAGTPIILNALLLVGALAIVLHAGIGHSVAVAVVLTGLEALGLAFVIVVGAPFWRTVDFLAMPRGGEHVGGVVAAAALIFFAYLGFDELGNFAEEMRHPERDLPRALFIALLATTAIYVLVALSAVAVVGGDRLGRSSAPLALVVREALGPAADTALSAVALAATANTVLLLLVAASRSVYGMAAVGALPGRLARVNRRGVPVAATTAVVLLAAAMAAGGNLHRLATMTDAAVLFAFIAVNGSLGWLAVRRTTFSRGLRRGADIGLPTAAVALCTVLLGYAGRASLVFAVGVMALGMLLSAKATGGIWRTTES